MHKLTIEHKPEWDTEGRIVYVPNPDRTPCIVFDAHRDASMGFAVKVGATRKTYIAAGRTFLSRCATF